MSDAVLEYTPREDLARVAAQPAATWTTRHNVHVGLNTTARVARTRPDRERKATLWLANYANREGVSTDSLSEQLGVDRKALRALLTDPFAEVKDIVRKIESMRSVLDANLRAPAQTEFCRVVAKAFRYAMENGALVEVIDITRTGKTTIADYVHLKNLDRAIYVNCTHTESYSSFIIDVARACGISISSGKKGKKVHVLEEQIRSMFARGLFNLLIVDEGHYLWPNNIALKPKRIEFLRSLWDEKKRQVAIVILSTPQALLSSNQALQKSKRWAPGQWEGRITRFNQSAKPSTEDVEKVARWHCPEGSASIINHLVLFAKIAPGFYGAMVNVLDRARFEAKEAGEKLNVSHIEAAQAEAIKGTELQRALQKHGVGV